MKKEIRKVGEGSVQITTVDERWYTREGTTREPIHLGILQVGYRRNKAGWKLTPVEDQFPLFLAAKQIWQKECEGVAPLRRDYPLSVSLAKP